MNLSDKDYFIEVHTFLIMKVNNRSFVVPSVNTCFCSHYMPKAVTSKKRGTWYLTHRELNCNC